MTNKQKALEISRKHQIEYLAQVSNTSYLQKISSDSECFGSALEMAEWKDNQFKEYLERKKAENGIDLEPASEIINEILNELFKEE